MSSPWHNMSTTRVLPAGLIMLSQGPRSTYPYTIFRKRVGPHKTAFFGRRLPSTVHGPRQERPREGWLLRSVHETSPGVFIFTKALRRSILILRVTYNR